MTEYRSLTESLKRDIEARRSQSPEQYRLASLEKRTAEHDATIKGCLWTTNTCYGNTQENRSEIEALKQMLALQSEQIANLTAAMGALQAKVDDLTEQTVLNSDRLDKAAEYLKTKGMK